MSLIQKAYAYIREQILQGEFMPGTLLSEVELAEQLNMSRTPVRSAMSQLESQGYVNAIQNRGIFVKEVSLKEILDMMEVQHAFQRMSLRVIVETGDKPDLAAMQAYLDGQIEATERVDYFSYLQHFFKFNRCLIEASRNSVALQMFDMLQDKMLRFSIVGYKKTPHIPHFSASKISRSILDHLIAGEYDEIGEIMDHMLIHGKKRMIELNLMKL
ncbi:DNA-binding transcriptional regulator, GntR family [Paenibacillus catalpae]|uniref:DNA-binding transcriptional regulator, GntR family n=1 Tax=Paenibacillus catalpae TaxID=1045775 RepID=A0A1I2GSQ7_9BACL|nr:GntR family transcriptional regulator [Paenibacillus catalpae]SFF20268.1 DNA-binding transcriptional regulator, GntR family [Paenibacillus catalpae]